MAKRKGKPQGIIVRGGPSAAAAAKAPPSTEIVSAAPTSPEPALAAAAAAVRGSSRKKKRRRQSSQAADRGDQAVDRVEEDGDAGDPPTENAAGTARSAGSNAGGVATSAGVPSPMLDFMGIGRRAIAEQVMSWFIWPLTPAVFFSEYWEKKPLHIKRQRPEFYGNLFSKASLDKYLSGETGLDFGKHINLMRFDSGTGKKVALSPLRPSADSPCERAEPAKVESAWAAGASIQVMHPQQYHEPAWRLLSGLEGSFGSLFGANAYLTPAGAQGLAPHFDDVEVFMLQLEGEKRWRLHAPPADEEYPLPRDYSRDFASEELGELLLECVLQPGDMLYLPRGTVHVGTATTEGFSHHLTVSTYQKMAWSNVMERVLVSAVEKAAGASLDFRTGLPVNFLRFMGTWHDTGDDNTEVAQPREAFAKHVKSLIRSLEDFLDLDEVCDELGVDFSAQRLPPPPLLAAANPAPTSAAKSVTLDSSVRWVEPSAVRLVLSTDPETSEPTAALFHSCSNERDLHMCRNTDVDEDIGCLRFEAATFMPALRVLYAAGSGHIRVRDLPLADEDDRGMLCENLLEAGLLELVPEGAAEGAVR